MSENIEQTSMMISSDIKTDGKPSSNDLVEGKDLPCLHTHTSMIHKCVFLDLDGFGTLYENDNKTNV